MNSREKPTRRESPIPAPFTIRALIPALNLHSGKSSEAFSDQALFEVEAFASPPEQPERWDRRMTLKAPAGTVEGSTFRAPEN